MNANTIPQSSAQTVAQPTKKPNENSTIRVEAYMRIFDPKTNQTLREGRA
jgi:hypothetical protein